MTADGSIDCDVEKGGEGRVDGCGVRSIYNKDSPVSVSPPLSLHSPIYYHINLVPSF